MMSIRKSIGATLLAVSVLFFMITSGYGEVNIDLSVMQRFNVARIVCLGLLILGAILFYWNSIEKYVLATCVVIMSKIKKDSMSSKLVSRFGGVKGFYRFVINNYENS